MQHFAGMQGGAPSATQLFFPPLQHPVPIPSPCALLSFVRVYLSTWVSVTGCWLSTAGPRPVYEYKGLAAPPRQRTSGGDHCAAAAKQTHKQARGLRPGCAARAGGLTNLWWRQLRRPSLGTWARCPYSPSPWWPCPRQTSRSKFSRRGEAAGRWPALLLSPSVARPPARLARPLYRVMPLVCFPTQSMRIFAMCLQVPRAVQHPAGRRRGVSRAPALALACMLLWHLHPQTLMAAGRAGAELTQAGLGLQAGGGADQSREALVRHPALWDVLLRPAEQR